MLMIIPAWLAWDHLWYSVRVRILGVARGVIALHPQTNIQVEHTIKTLEDMLRVYIIDFNVSWDEHMPFVEFCYNKS